MMVNSLPTACVSWLTSWLKNVRLAMASANRDILRRQATIGQGLGHGVVAPKALRGCGYVDSDILRRALGAVHLNSLHHLATEGIGGTASVCKPVAERG